MPNGTDNSGNSLSSAASAIYEGFSSGRVDVSKIPEQLDVDAGLQVQLSVLDLRLEAGESLGGWKVGLTSGAARDKMGKGVRPFGHILQRQMFVSGDSIPLDRVPRAIIEPELAFRIDRPLSGPDVTPDEVRSSISHALPAFEILQKRIPDDASHGLSVADGLGQWGIVLGAAVAWDSTAAETSVEMTCDAETVASVGPRFGIDEPMESIAVLCRKLSGYDRGLEEGQYVITGAFHKAPVTATGHWEARFSNVGSVEVDFA